MSNIHCYGSDPSEGHFCIYRFDERQPFTVKLRQKGKIQRIELENSIGHNGAINYGSIFDTIKYFTSIVGLTLINNNMTIDLNSVAVDNRFRGNATMVALKCNVLGNLFLKKIVSSDLQLTLKFYYNKQIKYDVFAGMYGLINLRNSKFNDNAYNYGIIIEQCYPIKDLPMNKILAGLKALMLFHEHTNCIHGDCNPSNIMCDKMGNVKIVDPASLVTRVVTYINEYYKDLTPKSEVGAYLLSCFEIVSDIRKLPLEKIFIKRGYLGLPEFADDGGINAIDFLTSLQDGLTTHSDLMSAIAGVPFDGLLANNEYIDDDLSDNDCNVNLDAGIDHLEFNNLDVDDSDSE